MSAINGEKRTWRTRLAAVRALAAIDAINLRDLHHVERMQHEDGILDLRARRAEQGKPNDSIAIILPPEQIMPMPEWMKRAKGVG